MIVENLRELEGLAPPLVERIGEEILGERLDGADPGIVVIRLKSLASGRGLKEWKERQPDGDGQGRMNRERFEELRRFYDGAFADLIDEVNLAIERLGG